MSQQMTPSGETHLNFTFRFKENHFRMPHIHIHLLSLFYDFPHMNLPNVWIIDHKDSFTWNLAELVRATGMATPQIIPNDSRNIDPIIRSGEKIILSPGPGIVHDSCHQPTFRLLERLPESTPLLGICLGHQIMGVHFGAQLEQLASPLHGCREDAIHTEESPLFAMIPSKFETGLYHSWRLSRHPLPDCLCITAQDQQGNILAIQHHSRPWFGIQFHPESILTPLGGSTLSNFLSLRP